MKRRLALSSAATLALLAPSLAAAEDGIDIVGRGQVDVAAIDAGDIGDGAAVVGELRRLQLGVRIDRGPYRLHVEVDGASGDDIEVLDAYLAWTMAFARLVVGQAKTPVSLNEQTSDLHITSMERASFTDAFGFTRQLGVILERSGDNYTLSGGVFAGAVNGLDGVGADHEWAIGARGTYAFDAAGGLVHLGASTLHRDFANGVVDDYNARPTAHLARRYLDTPNFASSDTFFGAEAAWISGPLHIEGEYGRLEAEGPVFDAGFQGGYIEGGYFLTGETRSYSGGRFGRTRPAASLSDGGPGAIELRGRVDGLDLDDGAFMGGEQIAVTAGVNWRLLDNVYVMAEAAHADIQGGPSGGGDVDLVQMRLGVDW